MTWHVNISEHTYEEILRPLPPDTRGALFALFRRLEDDPYEATEPFGKPGGEMYTAVFSSGILTVLINPDTQRITPLSVTAL